MKKSVELLLILLLFLSALVGCTTKKAKVADTIAKDTAEKLINYQKLAQDYLEKDEFENVLSSLEKSLALVKETKGTASDKKTAKLNASLEKIKKLQAVATEISYDNLENAQQLLKDSELLDGENNWISKKAESMNRDLGTKITAQAQAEVKKKAAEAAAKAAADKKAAEEKAAAEQKAAEAAKAQAEANAAAEKAKAATYENMHTYSRDHYQLQDYQVLQTVIDNYYKFFAAGMLDGSPAVVELGQEKYNSYLTDMVNWKDEAKILQSSIGGAVPSDYAN